MEDRRKRKKNFTGLNGGRVAICLLSFVKWFFFPEKFPVLSKRTPNLLVSILQKTDRGQEGECGYLAIYF